MWKFKIRILVFTTFMRSKYKLRDNYLNNLLRSHNGLYASMTTMIMYVLHDIFSPINCYKAFNCLWAVITTNCCLKGQSVVSKKQLKLIILIITILELALVLHSIYCDLYNQGQTLYTTWPIWTFFTNFKTSHSIFIFTLHIKNICTIYAYAI